jgi:hypothetical protein
VVVALSFAPSLVASVGRIRAARRLRGRPDRGVRSLVSVGMPVLEEALERSLALAAAMDSRGYGRRAEVPAATRRLTAATTLLGLAGIASACTACSTARARPRWGCRCWPPASRSPSSGWCWAAGGRCARATGPTRGPHPSG